jgi:hypothetical protein
MSYYLRLLDARGELVESFAPAALTSVVKLASEKVADFDKYATVYRVIRLTSGLYARPFMPIPPPKTAKRKKPITPLIVHIVSAELYHLDQKPI